MPHFEHFSSPAAVCRLFLGRIIFPETHARSFNFPRGDADIQSSSTSGGARTMARPRSVVRGRSYRFESEVRTVRRTKTTTTPTTRWLHARALLPLLLSLTDRPTDRSSSLSSSPARPRSRPASTITKFRCVLRGRVRARRAHTRALQFVEETKMVMP